MNKIKIELEISDQQIEDLMSSAAEGISYWADHANVNYTRHQEEKDGLTFENALTNNAFVRIYVQEEDKMKSYSLTKKKLLNAIGKAIMNNDLVLDDMDNVDADTVVQYALFGEVVYS